jgi:hypothetical protein
MFINHHHPDRHKGSKVVLWNGWVAKDDNRFGYEKWMQGGVKVGFIKINDIYNNDVGKGGVYAHETYEAK